MKKRVVIDIGHGSDSFPPSKGVFLPGGGQFHEHSYNSDVANLLVPILERSGVEVYLPQPPHSPTVALNTRIDEINKKHANKPFDLLVSIHANASSSSTASGFGTFHWHTSTNGKRAAEIMNKHMIDRYPIGTWGRGVWTSQPNHWTNFGILRATRPVAILTESFFFTNPRERELMTNQEQLINAAETHALAIGEYLGIPVKLTKPTPANGLLRVQTGAFASIDNAIRLQERVESAGFDTYLVKADDGLYKVQVGAFGVKENADRMAARLRSAGFDTFITTKSGQAANQTSQTKEVEKPLSRGDKVRITRNVDFGGASLSRHVLNNTYTIMSINGDRAVVGINGTVTAAMHVDNLERA